MRGLPLRLRLQLRLNTYPHGYGVANGSWIEPGLESFFFRACWPRSGGPISHKRCRPKMLSASGHQIRSRTPQKGGQRYLICETVGNCGSWQLLHITRTVDSWTGWAGVGRGRVVLAKIWLRFELDWCHGLGLIEVCLPPALLRLLFLFLFFVIFLHLAFIIYFFAVHFFAFLPITRVWGPTSCDPRSVIRDFSRGRSSGSRVLGGAWGLESGGGFSADRLAATINALRGKWRVPSSVCRPIWLLANWKNTKVIIHKKIFVETCMGTIALDVDFSKSVRSLVRSVGFGSVQEPALYIVHVLYVNTCLYGDVCMNIPILNPNPRAAQIQARARKKCRRWSQLFGFGAWAEEAPLPTQIIERSCHCLKACSSKQFLQICIQFYFHIFG